MMSTATRTTPAYKPEKLLHDFDVALKAIRPALEQRFPKEEVPGLIAETRAEFERMIPGIPYIGGKDNRLTWNMIGVAWFIAMYRVLKAHGVQLARIVDTINGLWDAYLDRYPAWLMRILGRVRRTRFMLNKNVAAARRSQERRYPEDWVYTFEIKPNADDLYAMTMTECGICKYCHAQGTDELLPYLCAIDFPMVKRMGMRLTRTQTLAEGGECCDFRVKRH